MNHNGVKHIGNFLKISTTVDFNSLSILLTQLIRVFHNSRLIRRIEQETNTKNLET